MTCFVSITRCIQCTNPSSDVPMGRMITAAQAAADAPIQYFWEYLEYQYYIVLILSSSLFSNPLGPIPNICARVHTCLIDKASDSGWANDWLNPIQTKGITNVVHRLWFSVDLCFWRFAFLCIVKKCGAGNIASRWIVIDVFAMGIKR